MWHSLGGFRVDNNALPVPVPFWECCTVWSRFQWCPIQRETSSAVQNKGVWLCESSSEPVYHPKAHGWWSRECWGKPGVSRATSAFSAFGCAQVWLAWPCLLPWLEPKGWHFHSNLWQLCSHLTAATPESTLRPYRLGHNSQLETLWHCFFAHSILDIRLAHQGLWANVMTGSLCSLLSANLWIENL